MKKQYFLNKHSLILIIALFGLMSCGENAIEFEVKSDFTIDANVTSASSNGSIVSDFEVESEIDLTDNIDNIDDISSLLVTGVELQLTNYLPANTFAGGITGGTDFYSNPLAGDLTVTLKSNSSDKVIFSGNINLGTNVGPSHSRDESDFRAAPIVVLQISETQAKDLIENKKVKLKIKMTNGVIRDNSFVIKMKVQSRAITSI